MYIVRLYCMNMAYVQRFKHSGSPVKDFTSRVSELARRGRVFISNGNEPNNDLVTSFYLYLGFVWRQWVRKVKQLKKTKMGSYGLSSFPFFQHRSHSPELINVKFVYGKQQYD